MIFFFFSTNYFLWMWAVNLPASQRSQGQYWVIVFVSEMSANIFPWHNHTLHNWVRSSLYYYTWYLLKGKEPQNPYYSYIVNSLTFGKTSNFWKKPNLTPAKEKKKTNNNPKNLSTLISLNYNYFMSDYLQQNTYDSYKWATMICIYGLRVKFEKL